MQPQKRQNIISVIFLWHPLAGLPQWDQIIFESVFVFLFKFFCQKEKKCFRITLLLGLKNPVLHKKAGLAKIV